MKSLRIDCDTRQEYKVMVSILLALGKKHYNGLTDPDKIVKFYWPSYKSIVLGDYFCGCNKDYYTDYVMNYSKDLGKIMSIIMDTSEIVIEGVGSYEAVVTKENVTVGCQTISHDKVLEIAQAIRDIKG